MAFQDHVKTIFAKNHRGTKFGEWVDFYPDAASTPQSIRVTISAMQRREVNGVTQDNREEIRVLIGRDPADEETGGVETLCIGAKIRRAVEKDRSQVPYLFSGEILYGNESQQAAVFHRLKRVVQGTTNQ